MLRAGFTLNSLFNLLGSFVRIHRTHQSNFRMPKNTWTLLVIYRCFLQRCFHILQPKDTSGYPRITQLSISPQKKERLYPSPVSSLYCMRLGTASCDGVACTYKAVYSTALLYFSHHFFLFCQNLDLRHPSRINFTLYLLLCLAVSNIFSC